MSKRSRVFERIRSLMHRRAQVQSPRATEHFRKDSTTTWNGLEPLEPRVLLDAIAWDGGGTTDLWSEAANWAGDVIPGTNDDVSIPLSGGVTVIYDASVPMANRTILSLVAHEAVEFQAASLTITSEVPTLETNPAAAWFTRGLILTGGDVNADIALDGDIRVSTADMVLDSGQVTGTVVLENSNLSISNGYSDPFDIISRGVFGTLDGDIASGQTLTLQGTSTTDLSHAVLTLMSDTSNSGTIRMDNVANTTANLDSGSHTFVNTATGVIEVLAGNGGPRDIRGTGTFTNQGAITVEAGVELTIRGIDLNEGSSPSNWVPITYQADGGTITGHAFLQHSMVRVTASPLTETEIVVEGFDNQLLTDVLANTTLRVLGTDTISGLSHAVLTLEPEVPANPIQVFGRIVLDAGNLDGSPASGGQVFGSSNLEIDEHQLMIDAAGAIDILNGEGTFREIRGTGELINSGQITVESDVELSISGIDLTADDPMLDPDWVPITYQADGGTITGPAFLQHSRISSTDVPPSATTIRVLGFDNQLISDLQADTTIEVLGTDTVTALSHAVLTLEPETPTDPIHLFGSIVLNSGNVGGSAPVMGQEFGSANLVLDDHQLIIESSGSIDALTGTGTTRDVRGTGTLTNQGAMTAEDTTLLTVRGVDLNEDNEMDPDVVPISFQADGGTNAGPVFLRRADVEVLSSPASPTTLNLVGFENTLKSDVLANTTLRVLAADSDVSNTPEDVTHAVLTVDTATVDNEGTILLDAVGDFSANLDLGGNTLINTASGVIDVAVGVGGDRSIRGTGTLINQGLISVEDGIFTPISGIDLNAEDPMADPNWAPLAFHADGGSIQGLGLLNHTDLSVTQSPATETTIHLVGFDNRLMTDNLANTTLRILGTDTEEAAGDSFSHGVLTLTQSSTTNFGTLVLDSMDIDPVSTPQEVVTSNLDLNGNTLINDATGTIEVLAGESEGRAIKNGALTNHGVVDVQSDLEFLFDAVPPVIDLETVDHTNTGSFHLADADVTLRGRSFFNDFSGIVSGSGELAVLTSGGFITNGTIRPGAPTGDLLIRGNARFGSDSLIEIEIAGPQAGEDFDALILQGDLITLQGLLLVSASDGFNSPGAGSFFPVLEHPKQGVASIVNELEVFVDPQLGLTQTATDSGVILGLSDAFLFDADDILPYSTQDNDGDLAVSVQRAGLQLTVEGNGWKKIDLPDHVITADTVLEFDFQSSVQGEIHAIGFDSDDDIVNGNTHVFQLYGTQTWEGAHQDFNDYSASAPGIRHYSIPVGDFFTGTVQHMTIIMDHDVAGADAQSVFSNVQLYEPSADPLDFDSYDVMPYSTQDETATVEEQDQGRRLSLVGNGWKKIALSDQIITEHTVLEFDFASSVQGDIQGIGFDNDDNIVNDNTHVFQLYGTQTWEGAHQDFNNYATSAPGTRHYRIPVGQFFTGPVEFMTFINDHDVPMANAENLISNIRLYEDVSDTLDVNPADILPYSSQDLISTVSVQNSGKILSIVGNGWKKIDMPYQVTSDTVLEFEFRSSAEGEVHAIGFDNDLPPAEDDIINDNTHAFQLFGTQTNWAASFQDFNNYATQGPGWVQYRIPVGEFFTGTFQYLTFINDHDVTNATGESEFANIRLFEEATGTLDLDDLTVDGVLDPYSTQDGTSTVTVEDLGRRLRMVGNGWKRINLPDYVITADTVLEFEFQSSVQGEIQAIGFDNDDDIVNDNTHAFQVYGTQTNWAASIQDFNDYADDAPGTAHYKINVGDFLTGEFDFLTFILDHDVPGANAESVFSNIRLYEDVSDTIDLRLLGDPETYSTQDGTSTVDITNNGRRVEIVGNGWKKLDLPDYQITANTILEFDFQSGVQGEIHAIGFDSDDNLLDEETTIAFQLYGTQTNWPRSEQAFNDYDTSAPGVQHYRIPVGDFFTGSADFLTLINDHDSGGTAQSVFMNIQLYEEIIFDEMAIQAYSTQDGTSTVTVEDSGRQLRIVGNGWKKVDLGPYTLTETTMMQFDFQSTQQGEIHAIGFDNDDNISNEGTRALQLYGTQTNWAATIDNFGNYRHFAPDARHHDIRVGELIRGEFAFLTFVNDDDAGIGGESVFSNIKLFDSAYTK